MCAAPTSGPRLAPPSRKIPGSPLTYALPLGENPHREQHVPPLSAAGRRRNAGLPLAFFCRQTLAPAAKPERKRLMPSTRQTLTLTLLVLVLAGAVLLTPESSRIARDTLLSFLAQTQAVSGLPPVLLARDGSGD
jgi:hypothetical protein